MSAPIEKVKALLAALPKEDQEELSRYLADILVTEDESEAIQANRSRSEKQDVPQHVASLEVKRRGGRTITYTFRQERVRCGKASCWCAESGLGHGPYTYKYWKEGGRLRKAYVGKRPPAGEVSQKPIRIPLRHRTAQVVSAPSNPP